MYQKVSKRGSALAWNLLDILKAGLFVRPVMTI